jgi:DNA-binding transcriptional LysR family regulator
MNLHQLSVFKAIVETGSFSKAAAELCIAQSAVSYHIKLLEAEVGDPLFLRVKTRVYLTEAGKVLWQHVERIFQAVEAAKNAIVEISQGHSGELHFGLGVSSLSDQLPGFLKHLKEICPRASFNVVMGSSPQILESIRANKLDLGIVSLPVESSDFVTLPLFYEEEEMVVITHKECAQARKGEIAPEELVGLPLILYNKSTATRSNLDRFFREADVTPFVFMEVDREEMMMSLVKSGLGAAILPRCVPGLQDDGESLRFTRLKNAYLRREVGVALLHSATRPYLVEQALQLCRQHFHASMSKSLSASQS